MTCCIYISPNKHFIPVIISDTRVTIDGVNDYKYSPNRININEYDGGYIDLQRKTIFMYPSVAVTCSGGLDSIKDYLEYVPTLVKYPVDPDRPLRGVSQRASSYLKGNLNTIVSYPQRRLSNDFHINFVSPDYCASIDYENYGIIKLIGSGSEEARKDILNNISQNGIPDNPLILAHSFVFHRTMQEIYRGIDKLDQSWGMVFEIFYFDSEQFCWKAQKDTISVIFQATVDKNFNIIDDFKLIDRVILQSCRMESGGILVIKSESDRINTFEYVIQNYISETEVSQVDWSQWRPEIINIGFVMLGHDGRMAQMCSIVPADEIDGFEINVNQNEVSLKLNNPIFNLSENQISSMVEQIKANKS